MEIHILSQETIGRIAAGEVVERPVNVAKELIENAIDAGATAITVELRDGGVSLLRVTDNGCGIEPSQIHRAFLRHATSKIADEDDLSRLTTLGFRGEALASIAAVSQIEMITKVRGQLTGVRAANDFPVAAEAAAPLFPPTAALDGNGGSAATASAASLSMTGNDTDGISVQEIGAPDGTTVIVRNLFYNVPVRKKFLKQPQTEAGYVTDLVERQALSHPEISFHYRVNGKEKLHTSGSGQLKELIYRIYGRETAGLLFPVSAQAGEYTISGLIGRPEISRSSRNFEVFFVNGRMLRSDVLSKAMEEGYGTDLMKHSFPFGVLHLQLPPQEIDVNVHPAKMEVRFAAPQAVYDFVKQAVHETLHGKELIPAATLLSDRELREQEKARVRQEERALQQAHAEPFESAREKGRAADEGVREQSGTAGVGASKQSSAADENAGKQSGSTGDGAREQSGAMNEGEGGLRLAEEVAPYLVAPRTESRGAPRDGEVLQTGDASESENAPFFFEDRRPRQEKRIFSAGENGDAGEAESPLSASFPTDIPANSPASAPTNASSSFPAGSRINVPASAPADIPAGGAFPAGVPVQAELFAAQTAFRETACGEGVPTEATPHVLSRESVREYEILGQIFETYWLVAFRDQLLMIDQHAAHEKVQYERLMRRFSENEQVPAPSQLLAPPRVVTLTGREEAAYLSYEDTFRRMGYEIEDFGDRSYALRAIPLDLYANTPEQLFRETLEEIMGEKLGGTPQAILSKIASMSCKAAVKGNTAMSRTEAEALIDELLRLENPYHCPHGRPTIVTLSKQEIEKKFKRIV